MITSQTNQKMFIIIIYICDALWLGSMHAFIIDTVLDEI